jgi:sterol desaturase/sphingolipid hydroxylase (fatty acid hydroxylase superfamily)
MFALEHSKSSYWGDYLVYATLVGVLAFGVCDIAPGVDRPAMATLAASGLFTWSLVEYVMHRFVLHAIEPFKTWHARHHERPTALISAPTALTVTLITLLVFVPALIATSIWRALSLTVGVIVGYVTYSLCHHATHHWRPKGRWLLERKRWHALHHGRGPGQCYGVTSNIWDRIFGTGPGRTHRRDPP